jgi:hypothetical protein
MFEVLDQTDELAKRFGVERFVINCVPTARDPGHVA